MIEIFKNMDLGKYRADVSDFEKNKIGLFENGNASKSITEWMIEHKA